MIAFTATGTLILTYNSLWGQFWQRVWGLCVVVIITAWLSVFRVTDTPPTSLPTVAVAAMLVLYGSPGLPYQLSIGGSVALTALSVFYIYCHAEDAAQAAANGKKSTARTLALAMAELLPLLIVNMLGMSVQARLHRLMDSLLTCTELNAQVNRLVVVLENMDGTMASTIDRYGKFVFVSASSKMMVGHTPGEMVGGCLLNYVHPNDQKSVESALEGAHLVFPAISNDTSS